MLREDEARAGKLEKYFAKWSQLGEISMLEPFFPDSVSDDYLNTMSVEEAAGEVNSVNHSALPDQTPFT